MPRGGRRIDRDARHVPLRGGRAGTRHRPAVRRPLRARAGGARSRYRHPAFSAALCDGRARAIRAGERVEETLMGLFWHFLLLGCLAVGGVSTVMPDMYRYVVDEQGLVTGRQFADLYALAQAAPDLGTGILRFPLLYVMAVLAPFALASAWKKR